MAAMRESSGLTAMVRNELNLEHRRDDEDISGRQKSGLVLCRHHGRVAGLRAGRALAGIPLLGHGVVDRRDWHRRRCGDRARVRACACGDRVNEKATESGCGRTGQFFHLVP